MGAVLEGTEETGPFGVEVRRESFYVSTSPDQLVLTAMRNGEGTGRFGVPAAKLADADPWTATRHGDGFVVGGPVITFGTDERERRPGQSVELVYGDAYWLARGLELLVRS